MCVFFQLLSLLLFWIIPSFWFDDGISALFKHCISVFMTYLFSFYSAFATFYFPCCHEKRMRKNSKTKSQRNFGVKCVYVYNLTDKGFFRVCLFMFMLIIGILRMFCTNDSCTHIFLGAKDQQHWFYRYVTIWIGCEKWEKIIDKQTFVSLFRPVSFLSLHNTFNIEHQFTLKTQSFRVCIQFCILIIFRDIIVFKNQKYSWKCAIWFTSWMNSIVLHTVFNSMLIFTSICNFLYR